MAAGASAEQAAQQAAEAAAAAGQAAFEAAYSAGASAEEAAQQAAAEAAEQSALRDLEARLESGEISEAEFQKAIQNVPPAQIKTRITHQHFKKNRPQWACFFFWSENESNIKQP